MVEETGVPGETTDLPQVSHKLYQIMLYLVYLAMVLLMHSSSDFFIVTCVIWYFSDLTTFFKMLFICLDFNYIHLSFVPVTQQTMAAEYMIACDTNHLQLFPRSWILWELAIHKRLFVRFLLVFCFHPGCTFAQRLNQSFDILNIYKLTVLF